MNDRPVVTIHADGGCRGNPGPGGWGALLQFGDRQKELWGGEANSTNNRMELMAAICALEALSKPATVHLHTDSQYVQKGISAWIHNWKRNGWRTAMTTRGFTEIESEQVAHLIADVLDAPADEAVRLRVRADVATLCRKFPVYGG